VPYWTTFLKRRDLMAENKESRWWICPKCEHEVLANDRPTSIKWTDGHVCHFVEKKEEDRENES
jgi:hypothetical protein